MSETTSAATGSRRTVSTHVGKRTMSTNVDSETTCYGCSRPHDVPRVLCTPAEPDAGDVEVEDVMRNAPPGEFVEYLTDALAARLDAERRKAVADALTEAADDYERMHQQPGSATGCRLAPTSRRSHRSGVPMNALVDWDSPRWGQVGHNVHHGTTDDLGDHGRHSDETEEQ